MEVSGARSSWLTMARKSARSRSTSSRGVMSCMVTTTDSTAPSRERMGVELTMALTLRPLGTLMTISSARTVSPALSNWAMGNSRRETSRPSARRQAGQNLQQGLRRLAGVAQALNDAADFPVEGHWRPGPGVEDGHPHRGGVYQRLQVGPGPPLLPVAVGVGDGQGCLGSEEHQRVLILPGEPLLARLVRQVEVAHPGALETDGRAEEAAQRSQGRADCRQTQGLVGVGGEVGHPQGFRQTAQVGEELRSPGQVHEPPVGLLGQARGNEGLELPRAVGDGEAAAAGPGEQARPVHHPVQDGVQVQVLGDAQAGFAQAGETIPQGCYLQVPMVRWVQAATSARTGRPSVPARRILS